MRTLLLLPGLACDGELFHSQQVALAGQGRVHVSDVHQREATLPAMAARLLQEHAGPLLLVGTSMGGMLALELWRQASDRVQGIALLGSTARADTPELITLRTQACTLFAAGRMNEVLRANVLFAFHPNNGRDKALVRRYLAMLRRAGAEQLITQNRAVMARADSRPLLPQLTCPLLVACGEADMLTPPEHAREIAALAPQARLEIVPGAGHMLTLEQPERVTTLLLHWLDGISPRA
ncbi:MAG: alpha/beta hydrolase [Rubrivivax sp.]|nr:alpha/beta hydrolase [Rubrivivax sp.]